MSTPVEIALAGIKSLEKNELVAVPGFRNKFNSIIVKFIPAKILMNILYRSRRKKITKL